ncbi:hypothetical protein [Leptospira stimsonii]|uniref:Lipoprotein n=1 Tax=Leptospira stimsonii TaxID=2202203 RepID=A0ABY2N4T9_9LEPT|nr:hypothetical protein [Leptospira stimsonii]TGK23579.1 hypothetical protein EHO98_04945 [Leptospira stimsonii]TGM16924.1 hypothetical protein EHQ90_08480 [Leptospira stimsonii]
MREFLGLILLFILVSGWVFKSCEAGDKTPKEKAASNKNLFPFKSCSCWKKTLPFSGFINRDKPEDGIEIYCSASLKNNSKETIKNASIRIYILSKNDYELDSIKLRADEDLYPAGHLIKFKSDSAIAYRENFSKTKCELWDYE